MKKIMFLCFIFMCSFLATAVAQDIKVDAAIICESIENRSPVNEGAVFSSDISKVYCFTRILGADSETIISHVWYWQGREMARVALSVQASSWRTWSSKNMLPMCKGNWKVEIVAGETILTTAGFVVE